MLYLHPALPAYGIVRGEGRDVRPLSDAPAHALRIALLNLMPKKPETELDFARVLAQPHYAVALIPLCFTGEVSHHTSSEHIATFYTDASAVESQPFDALIVTGAPVEHLDFSQVRYAKALAKVFDTARGRIPAALYICWGAQAALNHFYGIPKYALPAKRFGIFTQEVHSRTSTLLHGLSPRFPMPQSRHTEVRTNDITAAGLHIIAQSQESGVGIASARAGAEVYITGHLEYAPDTLQSEYRRDLCKGLPIAPPAHYYIDDRSACGIDPSWLPAAQRFYANWLATVEQLSSTQRAARIKQKRHAAEHNTRTTSSPNHTD